MGHILDRKRADEALKGLADIHRELGMHGVSNEIKMRHDVSGNVAYAMEHGVHERVGPRFNPSTKEFIPQSKRGREIEHEWIDKNNQLLDTAGEPMINKAAMLRGLRKKDREFERRVRRR